MGRLCRVEEVTWWWTGLNPDRVTARLVLGEAHYNRPASFQ